MDAELRELCERLRGLLAKATPGLLQRCGHDRGGCSCGMVFAQDSDCFVADFSLSGDDEMRSHRPEADTRKANAALHVAAVNALPRLLDTIAAQAAELEGVREIAEVRTRTILELTTLLANVPGESVIECVRNLRASAEKVEAELEGVRKDAERHRWLRSIPDELCCDHDNNPGPGGWDAPIFWPGAGKRGIELQGDELDAAIDTAIADSGAGGGA